MTKFWYDAEVLTQAQIYGLDPNLVKAVVMVESAGETSAYRYEPGFWMRYMAHKPEFDGANPRRVSSSYGLMQVMYTTATQHGFKDAPEALFIPLIGLAYGCAHLKYLLAQCDGNVEQALCQYNGGEGGNTKPPYRNAAYARKALAWYEQFKKEQDRAATR